MDATFWLNVLMRWLHVASAVVALGATVMMRFAVLPALSRMSNGEEILQAIRPGLKKLIHGGLGLAILTGFYNYLVVAIPAVRRAKETTDILTPYHPVMGMKMLLSIVLFVTAVILLKPVPNFLEKRQGLLSVNVVLGMVILLLAGYLRRLWAGAI